MKKTILFSVLILSLGAGAAFAHCGNCPGDKKAEAKKEAPAAKKAGSDCGDCPMHKKEAAKKAGHECPAGEGHGGKMCPEKIAGVTTVSKNIKNGVEITMTAKDKETVAQVQELALVHYNGKEGMGKGCPGRVQGADIKLENTADGIKVYITGKAPGIVKQIQEASAREHAGAAPARKDAKKEAKAAKKYMCAMKCVESVKPGKCPKCGMPMEEIK
jgi:hypothetical protein